MAAESSRRGLINSCRSLQVESLAPTLSAKDAEKGGAPVAGKVWSLGTG
jgi:hypothetical protein